jgi:CheY-like chemotaxis protein
MPAVAKPAGAKPAAPAEREGKLSHRQRNRLNTATLALHVVETQLQAGLVSNAQNTLQCAVQILESMGQSENEVADELADDAPRGDIEALIVEDDPVEESLLTSFLRLRGFRVETVRDGYEALEYLASHPRPDFILMDMRMPRLGGPATISAIRGNPQLRDLRIFAVTGLSPEEAGVPTGPEGVDRWFQKPLNPSRIVEAMSAAALN